MTRAIPSCSQEVPAITVCGLGKTYRSRNQAAVESLRDISFTIRQQEFVTIIGPSGCGKSTLLNLLVGLDQPTSGRVDLAACHSSAGRGGLVGYISQQDTLLPWRSVLDNVAIGMEIGGIKRQERRERARQLIDQVGLQGFEHHYPHQLSGGMRKRAAVIRTLAHDPSVIFMDEPFVGLDVQTRDSLEEDILRLWHRQRKTMVLVTHDLAEAIALSDRVILLTGRPATVKCEYPIPLPRPRSVIDAKFTPAFGELHRRIWQDLRAEVAQPSGGSHGD